MTMQFLRDELDRAVRVLGKDKGLSQNLIDIDTWLRNGTVNKDEARELASYAFKISE